MIASPRILALGDRKATAYTSQEHVLNELGDLIFMREDGFRTVTEAADFIARHRIDTVLFPNPYGNPKRLAIYRHCRKSGIPVIVFDRGGLPGTWFFDVGFNADSPSYSPKVWDKSLSVSEHEEVRDYIEQLLKSGDTLEGQGQRLAADRLRNTLGLGSEKILFVPFQRPTDTTILYFSGHVKDVPDFAQKIEELQRLLENGGEKWVILSKKHPLEVNLPSQNLRFVPDDTHVNDLLELCDAVCLVNSGVGLLATLFEKPVYHFGEIYYGHPQLNCMVKTAEDVLVGLKRELVPFSVETRDRLIHHLITKVYSLADFRTELMKQKGGAYRNITRHIEFSAFRFPPIHTSHELPSKRILFVTPVIPVPVNRGSAQRTQQVLHAMRRLGHQVDIAILNRNERGTDDNTLIERLETEFPGSQIFVVRHPSFLRKSTKVRARLQYLSYVLALLWDVLTLDYWRIHNHFEAPSNFRRAISRLLGEAKYDIIYSNYLKVSPREIIHKHIFAIADLHDIQTNRITNDVAPRWPIPFRRFLLRIFERSEKKLMNRFDELVAITDVERDEISKRFAPCIRVEVLPVTFTPNEAMGNHEHPSRVPYDLVFVGSNSDANAASLNWFLSDIFPLIKAKSPGCRLLLQGSIARNKGLKLLLEKRTELAENLNFGEYVPDVRAIYEKALIAISPTTHGTGMKVKVVEALMYGKPIVGTSVAFEGIHAEDGVHALIADEATAFADKLLTLLKNDDLRSRIGRKARELFQQQHSFEHTAVPLMRKIL